ncbi:MAG TPA: hypothetical protein VGV13_11640 [Methylomirabilota bacterium]|jgi:hypothetical protein|nr:hypothetical protein [Methylomirabilota bacterium]
MGFYLGFRGLHQLPEELSPVITPCEFVAALSKAIRAIVDDGQCRSWAYEEAIRAVLQRRPGVAVRAFSRLLSAAPFDHVVYRMLALAQLYAGNPEGAMQNLKISLALSRHGATIAPSLGCALRVHLHGSLARLALLLIHGRLGQRDAARGLALEGLIP